MNDQSPLVTQAEAFVRTGRIQDAVRLLQSPLGSGDPAALTMLAFWKVSGQLVPRDLGEARELFGRAAQAGSLDAAHFHVAFTCHGAGGRSDWPGSLMLLRQLAAGDSVARRQLALIETMDLTDEGDPRRLPRKEQLSACPQVWAIRGLFSPAECKSLIREAEPRLQRALVTDRVSGREQQNVARTSETAAFPLILENPFVHALNKRLAAISETDVRQGEPLQVLRYNPGQEYRPHFDALAPGSNQRVLTALVYLNDGYEGGETRFVRTGLTFKGGVGDALVFRNTGPDEQPDLMAEHAGLPVLQGTKMIASRWIRAKPIDLSKPLT